MTGWFKLHRELYEKPIWMTSTPEQKVILMTLMSMANFEAKEWEWKGEKYKVQPGQFITSLPSIVAKCGKGITIQNVRTALKRFEKYEFLTDESTKQNRLITIANWGIYQGLEASSTDDLTDDQQTTNRQLTASKKERTIRTKEVKESNSKDSSPKQVYDEASDEMILVRYFIKKIRVNSPEFREPNLQTWADDFRKLMTINKKDKKEIAEVIQFVQTDSFEIPNVLSPAKLRKRYESLLLKMKQPKGANNYGAIKQRTGQSDSAKYDGLSL